MLRYLAQKSKGVAAYLVFLLGMHEVDRRGLENAFHEGGVIFVLMVILIISALAVYGWLCNFVYMCRDPGHMQVRSGCCKQIRARVERLRCIVDRQDHNLSFVGVVLNLYKYRSNPRQESCPVEIVMATTRHN